MENEKYAKHELGTVGRGSASWEILSQGWVMSVGRGFISWHFLETVITKTR